MASSLVAENRNIDSRKEGMGEHFYRPLCFSGYLTPLQRKKLREKRPFELDESLEMRDSKKILKSRVIKRKKEHLTKLSNNSKMIVKKMKLKDCVSQIQCSAAKVISKSNDSIMKDKKFFKSSSPNRLNKAHFSMPFVFKKNVFLNIDKCVKESLSTHTKHILNEQSVNSDQAVNSNEDVSNDAPSKNTNDVGPLLAEMSESSPKKLSIFDFDWPSDEVLLQRQERARANVKHRVIKGSEEEQKGPEKDINDAECKKLYPIFYTASRKQSSQDQDAKCAQKVGPKRLKKSLSGVQQMIIDAGQKDFGARLCSVCNMLYSIGLEEDEKLHFNYHHMYLVNLKFLGWKDENVVGEYRDGRIVLVKKNDANFKIKKIEDVLMIVNRDLGFPSSTLPLKSDIMSLLFISSSKQVVGCVLAELISHANRVVQADNSTGSKGSANEGVWKIGNWYSSSDTVPAVCGINRVWVAHNYRRQKIASRIIDCLRYHFIYGHVVGIRELAFTDPSPDGREFAAYYTGTDNFLVYR